MSPASNGGYSLYRRRKPGERSGKLSIAKKVLDSTVAGFIEFPSSGLGFISSRELALIVKSVQQLCSCNISY